ncbi:1-acyl-sn-glycerol-3-phosphate acyltransferase [Flavobacterium agricola]|uniref:1-acyl-sn-glycerol-3-phosphate acyltransferase n=1 Tax=Flavobacterium agricola TaxID=2870839 RepID=A0ABY6LXR6_9FLAO|nr:lysophospholipid acyltransferase family protein [Flavobacterium agricola]UYW01130.1 1-acyl-sn-glycerol-3-phosphate acyltransferase [Flavobacterium agricola]
MKKIISYPFSILYVIALVILLVIFQPIQWVCLKLFGYQAHKKSVDILNFFLAKSAYLIFSSYSIEGREKIPTNAPIIFVANHQSLFDIVGIISMLNQWHPKFIAKIELGKGIPSVSFNLKYGGSVLINRKDPKQALPVIKGMSQYIEKYNRSAVIFPEGTRSRTGQPKHFSENGLKILCKYAPSAYVVPITINNSWKMLRYGNFPMGLGTNIKLKIHEPLAVKDYPFEQLFQTTKDKIISDIKN